MMQTVDELLGQLRGVTGPEPAPPPEPIAWLPWTIAIVSIAVVVTFWWWLRRPRQLLPPNVEALNELKKLPATPTALALTHCEKLVRRYLERRHLLPVRMLTPVELIGQVSDEWRELLQSLQDQRFAPAQSAREAWSGLVRQLESLIQRDCVEVAEQVSHIKSAAAGNRL